jgi:hypothetical protein
MPWVDLTPVDSVWSAAGCSSLPGLLQEAKDGDLEDNPQGQFSLPNVGTPPEALRHLPQIPVIHPSRRQGLQSRSLRVIGEEYPSFRS